MLIHILIAAGLHIVRPTVAAASLGPLPVTDPDAAAKRESDPRADRTNGIDLGDQENDKRPNGMMDGCAMKQEIEATNPIKI